MLLSYSELSHTSLGVTQSFAYGPPSPSKLPGYASGCSTFSSHLLTTYSHVTRNLHVIFWRLTELLLIYSLQLQLSHRLPRHGSSRSPLMGLLRLQLPFYSQVTHTSHVWFTRHTLHAYAMLCSSSVYNSDLTPDTAYSVLTHSPLLIYSYSEPTPGLLIV